MFPCCILAHKKFINDDGSLDRERVESLLMADQYASDEKKEAFCQKPCTCECHQDGIRCRH